MTDTPAHTPLPCPFCGSDHLTVCEIVGRGYTIECEGCHIEGPLAKDGPSLLKRWNARACNSYHQLVEALRDAIKELWDRDHSSMDRIQFERDNASLFAALSQAGGASE